MGIIKILDESVSNIIAAGEVVENPTAMLKELLENSLDAESTQIRIEVKKGGRELLISDNGKGMGREDLLICVERHATSKISKKEDLFNLASYGFRGEALASICAVSKVRVTSKTEESLLGNSITVSAGKITSLKEMEKERGTQIEIDELFFNTPARLKFLRKNVTEYANMKEIVIQEALANPQVSITLLIEGRESVRSSGNGIENAIVEIFGRNTLKNLIKTDMGYIGNTSLTRSTKDSIFTFVNGRIVKSRIVENAVMDSYYTKLSKGRYPFAIIFLQIDPGEVDVNVHPSKKIVKFSDDRQIYEKVKRSIDEKISGTDILTGSLIKSEDFLQQVTSPIIKRNVSPLKESYNITLNLEKFEKISEEKKELPKVLEVPKISQPPTSNEITKVPRQTDYREPKIEEKKIEENIIREKIISEKEIVPERKIEKVPNYRIIGQFMNSYILVEKDKNLEIYDQHIVHERILYEELKSEPREKKINSQHLLVPKRLRIDPRERDFIAAQLKYLEEFGFDVEFFDDRELLIRSVPLFQFKEGAENLFQELLEELKGERERDPREKIIISMSCRGAIKAGEMLKYSEMESLVKRLHEIGEYTCPHGRPIIIRLGLDEIEKKFKRK
ncbi:MAG: DNA mismatch repair endonuclease MutL [Fusobacteriaceae bacterium]